MLSIYFTRGCVIAAALLIYMVGTVGIASGQSMSTPAAAAAAATVKGAPIRPRGAVSCTDVDPLIGDWEVVNADKVTTDSQFKTIINNCALLQTYTPRNGGRAATCLIAYDSSARDWVIWVAWADGTRSQYTHGVLSKNVPHDGAVVNELRFDAVGTNGALQHLAFFAMPDGTLREWQESSTDGGKTWKENFDRLWRKKG